MIDWITDSNTCFLIGAGCSKCAGKPLIAELTEAVKESLSEPAKGILNDLRGSHNRPATVEDLINHLLQIQKLISSRKSKTEQEWTLDKITEEITKIQNAIVNAIGTEWKSSEVHKNFILRLTGQKTRPTCDIFSINYDTIIEASLEDLKLPYTDGFRGSENAFFDPSLYDQMAEDGTLFRLFKLHGSINWFRDSDETVRRRSANMIEDRRRAVIYPAEQKYIQTQYGIYEVLLSRFRSRLREERPNNKLVVLGYSFSDEHINLAIEDSILSLGSNLTVFAFIGPEKDKKSQARKYSEIAERCDNRFNVFIGEDICIGSAFQTEEFDEIKTLGLWKFENLVELSVGGPS